MLEEADIQCPFCWETITIEVDLSAGSARYTEDCQVCCHPLVITLNVDDAQRFSVDVEAE